MHETAKSEKWKRCERPRLACILSIALGFGSHASKEAIGPAESVLESLGVTALGYACLTVAPIALGLVSPILWGRLWDHDDGLAFILAPSGEFAGAALLAAGLHMHAFTEGAHLLLANVLIVIGFFSISAAPVHETSVGKVRSCSLITDH